MVCVRLYLACVYFLGFALDASLFMAEIGLARRVELEFRFQDICAGSRQVALVFGKRVALRCRWNRCFFVSIGARTAVFWSFDRHLSAKRPKSVQ